MKQPGAAKSAANPIQKLDLIVANVGGLQSTAASVKGLRRTIDFERGLIERR